MKPVIAVTGSDEQCKDKDTFCSQCAYKKVCTITYLKKGEDEHYICIKRCLAHANHYAVHLTEKYDLQWIKMEFDD